MASIMLRYIGDKSKMIIRMPHLYRGVIVFFPGFPQNVVREIAVEIMKQFPDDFIIEGTPPTALTSEQITGKPAYLDEKDKREEEDTRSFAEKHPGYIPPVLPADWRTYSRARLLNIMREILARPDLPVVAGQWLQRLRNGLEKCARAEKVKECRSVLDDLLREGILSVEEE